VSTPTNSTAPTILVVEDDAATRGWMDATLRGQGYNVVTATDGREAMDRLRADPAPDLILLDMLLPVLDGWHLLGQVRGLLGGRSVPIIVVTGTILTREWAEQHGCAGFLRKPCDEAALLGEVGRCLGRGAA
jgi:CheY-like chemotaxis protein